MYYRANLLFDRDNLSGKKISLSNTAEMIPQNLRMEEIFKEHCRSSTTLHSKEPSYPWVTYPSKFMKEEKAMIFTPERCTHIYMWKVSQSFSRDH
jgi:hypothetical protein